MTDRDHSAGEPPKDIADLYAKREHWTYEFAEDFVERWDPINWPVDADFYGDRGRTIGRYTLHLRTVVMGLEAVETLVHKGFRDLANRQLVRVEAAVAQLIEYLPELPD